MNRHTRSSWQPAVGLWGPRSRFCGGRLEVYVLLRRAALTRGLYSDSPTAETQSAGGVGRTVEPPPVPTGGLAPVPQMSEGART